MSSAPNTSSSLSNFETLFDTALAEYSKRTGQDLRNHPLAADIDRCRSPDSILAIFRAQSQAFGQFRNGDPELIKLLTPVVNGLHAISTSTVLSAGASFAFPPANLIFSGIGVLLSTAKDVRDSYDTLVDVFECIENFTRRLKIYTEIRPTPVMIETMVKIMVELLAVLAFATKQIKQGRLKKFARKLLGEKDIESVLQRLDRLTLEESKMTVAQTLDVVYDLANTMEVVMEDGKASTDDIQETLVLMREIAMKVNKIERDQLQEKIRLWLSPPPDPWTNYNTARKAHHPGTAMWFIQSDTFRKWKSTGSLLWVQGLTGSGKTIFSSSIIKDILDMCPTGLAILAIFYFHFGDTTKQDARNMVSSVLFQLCSQSDKFSEALSSIHSSHDNGSREPDISTLLECLKTILTLQGEAPLYVVVDALDECPNSSGLPTQREEVLEILKELIDLKLPRVHFCVTSRPEIDIRRVFDPLNPYNVSLHHQYGQIKDLTEYVKSVVGSDVTMQNWPTKVKELVIDTLARKGGGMFRWAYCQLETLRQCPLRYIPSTLGELPETLDETYERILQGIPKKMWNDTHCILQLLAVSSRPLRVEEVAEVFAINLDEEVPGIPSFDPSWRVPNAETAVLSACSTLVTIVDAGWRGKIVEFSHFSVKEYLTSDRIENVEHISRFHIRPKLAHTLLAKACLSVLCHLDPSIDEAKPMHFPLAEYAAERWVEHAQFEDVSSYILDGMDLLFEKDKPHFATWVGVYNIDKDNARYLHTARPEQLDPIPLYYAALCGFRGLVERLLTAHPQDLNAEGGVWGSPLKAAVAKGHSDIVLFLLNRGADRENRGKEDQTALYIASSCGYTDIVRSLIDRSADLNAICQDHDEDGNDVRWTPLLVAIFQRRQDTAILLLERGADTEIRSNRGETALYMASSRGCADIVRQLVGHRTDPNTEFETFDMYRGVVKSTPLHGASYIGNTPVARILLEHNTNPNATDNSGATALHTASSSGRVTVVELLLEYGANADVRDKLGWTPLHEAAFNLHLQVVEVLLNHGADPNAQTNDRTTPIQLANKRSGWWISRDDQAQIIRLLSERTSERM